MTQTQPPPKFKGLTHLCKATTYSFYGLKHACSHVPGFKYELALAPVVVLLTCIFWNSTFSLGTIGIYFAMLSLDLLIASLKDALKLAHEKSPIDNFSALMTTASSYCRAASILMKIAVMLGILILFFS